MLYSFTHLLARYVIKINAKQGPVIEHDTQYRAQEISSLTKQAGVKVEPQIDAKKKTRASRNHLS